MHKSRIEVAHDGGHPPGCPTDSELPCECLADGRSWLLFPQRGWFPMTCDATRLPKTYSIQYSQTEILWTEQDRDLSCSIWLEQKKRQMTSALTVTRGLYWRSSSHKWSKVHIIWTSILVSRDTAACFIQIAQMTGIEERGDACPWRLSGTSIKTGSVTLLLLYVKL